MSQASYAGSEAKAFSVTDALYSKIAWRIMPILFIGYIIAYLDRVNVGFAKLQMMDALKFSNAVYGFGAGVFFLGYFIFEVPSNVILHKVGARLWICRVLVVWGLVSACTAFVKTPWEFYSIRFLLGIAEAGFFPGMVLYLTYWFPSHRRAKMIAMLMAGNPVSGILGGPVSGYILHSMGHLDVMGSYAIGFWQPTIIRQTGIKDSFTIGLLTMIPYTVALVSMILVGQHADKMRERRWHVVLPQLVAACGFVLCTQAGGNIWVAMIGLVMAAAGVVTALPMFWSLPTSFLGGAGAAAGIAFVNCTGNLAGFFSPAIIGFLRDYTHTLNSGLILIAGCLIASAALILTLVPAKLVNR